MSATDEDWTEQIDTLIAEVERLRAVVDAVYEARDFFTTIVWQDIPPRHKGPLLAICEAMKQYEAAGGRKPAQNK